MPLIPTDHPWARQDGVAAAAAAAAAAAEDAQQDGEDDRIEVLPGDEKKDDLAVAVRLSLAPPTREQHYNRYAQDTFARGEWDARWGPESPPLQLAAGPSASPDGTLPHASLVSSSVFSRLTRGLTKVEVGEEKCP